MADYAFAKATSWDEVYGVHRQWVLDYNAEEHWAHHTREDGRRSPEDDLGKLVVLRYDPNELHPIFHPLPTALGSARPPALSVVAHL